MSGSETELMRAVARRWIEEGWNRGDASVVDELHSDDFVDHDSAGRASDNAGFKQGIRDLYRAFPDFSATLDGLVIDGETASVAVRWSATGTHRAAYLGVEATGRSIRFKGIEIIRLRGGRITERWGEWDGIDLLQQLGAVEL